MAMQVRSRGFALFVFAGLLFYSWSAWAVPYGVEEEPRYIPNQYIVALDLPLVPDLLQPIDQLVATLLPPLGGTLINTYNRVFHGFTVRMTPRQAARLAANPLVRFVEQDQEVMVVATQTNVPWGLDRVDDRRLPLDGSYVYPNSTGANVHVYVIDTGLNGAHEEFTGRVGSGRNFVAEGLLGLGGVNPDHWQDCHGHGTHVAGTILGTTWGVAKRAIVHPVRVLDCWGSGSVSSIISAMEWIAANAQLPAVANMSFGTVNGRSEAQEEAVRGLYHAGIVPVVAAGNAKSDACNTSPAAEPLAVTVGAIDATDAQASYSNFGACVDIYAPGTGVESADYKTSGGSILMSGTSMATPHVAGAAALLLGKTPSLNPSDVTMMLLATATPGAVINAGPGSPNLLLYVDSTDNPSADIPPIAAFTVSCTALTCNVDGSSSRDDKGVANYRWDFGDGRAGSGVAVQHGYPAAGSYRITLTVTDTTGQTASASRTVDVASTVEPPAPVAPCTGCARYAGTPFAGGQIYHETAFGFTFGGGTLEGFLEGPAGANFNLYLESYKPGFLGLFGTWSAVQSATTAGASERIKATVPAGTYRWRVHAASGSGGYVLYGNPH